jgi:hypothetical protein
MSIPGDLSAASSAAMEFLTSAPAPSGEPADGGNTPDPASTASNTPHIVAPSGTAPSAVAQGQAPQGADGTTQAKQDAAVGSDLPDTTQVKLADGSVTTLGDLRQGNLRHADYTRKTQELAQQRQQLAGAVQQAQRDLEAREQATMAWLQDENNLLSLIEQTTGKPIRQIMQALQGQQSDPNEIATVGQAQQYAQQQMQQVQKQIEQLKQDALKQTRAEISAATRELKTQQETAQYSTKLVSTIANIFEEHPILNAVEGMEDVLRFKVHQRQPATIEEAVEFFKDEAGKQATRLNERYESLNKVKAANKEKLLSGGIEPPGGTAPQQAPTKFKSLKDPNLKGAVEAYLQNNGRNR